MSSMQSTTSVHPATITQFSRGEVAKLEAPKIRGRNKNGPVTHTKVDVQVWKVVQDLLKQNKAYTVVEIVAWDTVIIR